MEAPVAVKFVETPLHITEAAAPAVIVGNGSVLVATVIAISDDTQPPAVTVATTI